MKLGELCDVINGAMFIKYSNNKGEDMGFGFTELHSNKNYTVVKILPDGM